MKSIGTPPSYFTYLDLHTDTTSRVRVNGCTPEPFLTTSGMRQRCVLVPSLFCRATDWIMGRCAGSSSSSSSRFVERITRRL